MLGRKRLVVVVVVLVLFVLPTSNASALEVPYDVDRLCRDAAQVVWGEVLNVAPHWLADGTGISSRVSVAVNQRLKGAGVQMLTLEVPGGEVGSIGQWVEDAPQFAAGEEIILFLDDSDRVVGGQQGKFTVADGRVIEAGMQPLSDFVADLCDRLALQESVHTDGGRRVSYTEAQLEQPSSVSQVAGDWVPLGAELQALQPLKREGFEETFPNTWAIVGTPTWGAVSYRAHSGSFSGYCAASGTGAVTPPGPYPANVNTQMLWGPFSLADAVSAEVCFWHYTKTEPEMDMLRVMVSLDGISFYGLAYSGNWTTAPGNVDGWVAETLNLRNVPILGNLCGRNGVYLAIWFTSDGVVQDEGVYVDDIVLRKQLADAAAPQIRVVDPVVRAAGIGQTVTLTGSAFGATRGNSTVRFWSRGNVWVDAAVVSWSDTRVVCRVPAGASSHTTQAIHLQTARGSAYAGFAIPWSYLGYRWPGEPVLVRYYIGAGTADCAGVNVAVRQGAQQWTMVDQAYHAVKFWGRTSRVAPELDGYNVVCWADMGATGRLATTCITYDKVLKTILEFDMVFNDTYLWSTSAVCPANRYDVRNAATHEFGHVLGLADLYGDPDSDKTMYGFDFRGETFKRTLAPEEILGIQWIY